VIVRERPSGLKMFLLLRGTILPRILPSLLATTLIAMVVTFTHGDLFSVKITLTTIQFSLIGLPIAIFLGFRNTAAYDRFWEGRKLWGELLLRSRNISRQCQNYIGADVPAKASLGMQDVRMRMRMRMGEDLGQCLKDGRIEACVSVSIETTLCAMTAAAASCERFKSTPIPFSHTSFGLDALSDTDIPKPLLPIDCCLT
jgi:putative membrane protein